MNTISLSQYSTNCQPPTFPNLTTPPKPINHPLPPKTNDAFFTRPSQPFQQHTSNCDEPSQSILETPKEKKKMYKQQKKHWKPSRRSSLPMPKWRSAFPERQRINCVRWIIFGKGLTREVKGLMARVRGLFMAQKCVARSRRRDSVSGNLCPHQIKRRRSREWGRRRGRGRGRGEAYSPRVPRVRVRENQSPYLRFLPNADGDHLSPGAYPRILEPALAFFRVIRVFGN